MRGNDLSGIVIRDPPDLFTHRLLHFLRISCSLVVFRLSF